MSKIAIAVVFVVLACVPVSAFAETITISVKGMVCSFCAQGIKKTLSRKEGVEKVEVDLDKKLVTITPKPGAKLDDADLKESIVDSGYEVVKIERVA